ncbi:MAG TPA: hypothetical protein VF268_06580 [Gammaproteobacteria bacterium]
MKCFNHPFADAQAICQHCGKCLCQDCHELICGKISCNGQCATLVAEFAEYVELSKQAIKKTGKAYFRSSFIYFASGTLFLLFGLAPLIMFGSFDAFFMAPLGLIFVIGGFLAVRSGKHIQRNTKA